MGNPEKPDVIIKRNGEVVRPGEESEKERKEQETSRVGEGEGTKREGKVEEKGEGKPEEGPKIDFETLPEEEKRVIERKAKIMAREKMGEKIEDKEKEKRNEDYLLLLNKKVVKNLGLENVYQKEYERIWNKKYKGKFPERIEDMNKQQREAFFDACRNTARSAIVEIKYSSEESKKDFDGEWEKVAEEMTKILVKKRDEMLRKPEEESKRPEEESSEVTREEISRKETVVKPAQPERITREEEIKINLPRETRERIISHLNTESNSWQDKINRHIASWYSWYEKNHKDVLKEKGFEIKKWGFGKKKESESAVMNNAFQDLAGEEEKNVVKKFDAHKEVVEGLIKKIKETTQSPEILRLTLGQLNGISKDKEKRLGEEKKKKAKEKLKEELGELFNTRKTIVDALEIHLKEGKIEIPESDKQILKVLKETSENRLEKVGEEKSKLGKIKELQEDISKLEESIDEKDYKRLKALSKVSITPAEQEQLNTYEKILDMITGKKEGLRKLGTEIGIKSLKKIDKKLEKLDEKLDEKRKKIERERYEEVFEIFGKMPSEYKNFVAWGNSILMEKPPETGKPPGVEEIKTTKEAPITPKKEARSRWGIFLER